MNNSAVTSEMSYDIFHSVFVVKITVPEIEIETAFRRDYKKIIRNDEKTKAYLKPLSDYRLKMSEELTQNPAHVSVQYEENLVANRCEFNHILVVDLVDNSNKTVFNRRLPAEYLTNGRSQSLFPVAPLTIVPFVYAAGANAKTTMVATFEHGCLVLINLETQKNRVIRFDMPDLSQVEEIYVPYQNNLSGQILLLRAITHKSFESALIAVQLLDFDSEGLPTAIDVATSKPTIPFVTSVTLGQQIRQAAGVYSAKGGDKRFSTVSIRLGNTANNLPYVSFKFPKESARLDENVAPDLKNLFDLSGGKPEDRSEKHNSGVSIVTPVNTLDELLTAESLQQPDWKKYIPPVTTATATASMEEESVAYSTTAYYVANQFFKQPSADASGGVALEMGVLDTTDPANKTKEVKDGTDYLTKLFKSNPEVAAEVLATLKFARNIFEENDKYRQSVPSPVDLLSLESLYQAKGV